MNLQSLCLFDLDKQRASFMIFKQYNVTLYNSDNNIEFYIFCSNKYNCNIALINIIVDVRKDSIHDRKY